MSETPVRPLSPPTIVRLLAFLSPFFTAAGCLPNIPFHFAETAEVLKGEQVQITPAAGYYGALNNGGNACHCGLGGLRLRVGVGHDQEVGIEGGMVLSSDGLDGLSGKLSWKVRAQPWLALIAGAGVAWINGDQPLHNYGFDLGLVASGHLTENLALYGGVRLNVALPFSTDLHDDPAADASVILPIGLAIDLATRVRFFAEIGLINSTYFGPDGNRDSTNITYLYGAIACSFLFGNLEPKARD